MATKRITYLKSALLGFGIGSFLCLPLYHPGPTLTTIYLVSGFVCLGLWMIISLALCLAPSPPSYSEGYSLGLVQQDPAQLLYSCWVALKTGPGLSQDDPEAPNQEVLQLEEEQDQTPPTSEGGTSP